MGYSNGYEKWAILMGEIEPGYFKGTLNQFTQNQ